MDTLTAIQQHGAYVARAEFNAAKTMRQTATIRTRGWGSAMYAVTFNLPYLTTRPIVSTGWVLISGYVPKFSDDPSPQYIPFEGVVVSVGVRSWVSHLDGQGHEVFTGANILIFVQTLTGGLDSAGEPASFDYTIEHDITFDGLAYRPVPQQVAS